MQQIFVVMLEKVQEQFYRLVSAYETEKKRRIVLQEQLERNTVELEGCRKQIKELETQIDRLRLASAFSSGADNSESKREIESLIKEIDRCISLLKS